MLSQEKEIILNEEELKKYQEYKELMIKAKTTAEMNFYYSKAKNIVKGTKKILK